MSTRLTDGPLRIGVDARAASHPQPGGFKSYVTNLVDALAAVDLRNTYRLYVDRPSLEHVTRANPHFKTKLVTSRPPILGPVLREQVLLPATAMLERVDVLHMPAGTGPIRHPAPRVVTIHDALEHMLPVGGSSSRGDPKRRAMRMYNRVCQRFVARQAQVVITDSEHSRNDLVRLLGLTGDRIRVISPAPGPTFRRLPGPAKPTDQPYILAIGSADPRKNLVTLLRAYAALPSGIIGHYRLALVWTHGALREDLQRIAIENGIAERIHSIAAPSDEDLCRLLNGAELFVFPSLYEGFGLPPLEAMACGTPVVASNRSSLPEVLGDAAVLINPDSIAELSAAIERVLEDPLLRADMARRGMERAAGYSWAHTARLTLATYEEASAQGSTKCVGLAAVQ